MCFQIKKTKIKNFKINRIIKVRYKGFANTKTMKPIRLNIFVVLVSAWNKLNGYALITY